MKRVITIALAAVALAGGIAVRAQQPTRRFVPVTDAMLQKPDPADWLMWRRTLDGWGYSPLDQINRNNVSQLRMVWTHGLGPGQPGGHAARPRRRDVRAGSRRLHHGGRREDRRHDLGVPAQAAEGRGRQDRSRDRHLGQPHHQLELRQLHLRAQRADRRAGVGNAGARCRRSARRPAAARSSPTAKSSPAASASPTPAATPASSPRTTPEPARNCGASTRFPGRASRATNRGATCR